MDYADVTNKRQGVQTAAAPSTRQRSNSDYARQSAVDDSVRQKERAQSNREAQRRQSMAEIQKSITEEVFKRSVEQDRIEQRQNMQAGVEKMVRTVIRKESSQADEPPRGSGYSQDRKVDEQDPIYKAENTDQQARYMKEKVGNAYHSFEKESPRERELRPSPSELQQKRAVERYQDSTQNSIDRTLELVV